MTEIATPTRRPLSGPTGRRVAAHRGELREVLHRHGVTNPEIFGSTARGDAHEDSDVDLLVDFAPGPTFSTSSESSANCKRCSACPSTWCPAAASRSAYASEQPKTCCRCESVRLRARLTTEG